MKSPKFLSFIYTTTPGKHFNDVRSYNCWFLISKIPLSNTTRMTILKQGKGLISFLRESAKNQLWINMCFKSNYIPIFLLFISPVILHAEKYILFYRDGTPAGNYNEIVSSLKPGDIVRFSRGQEFQIKKVLGGHTNTKIIEIRDGKSLRIAKTKDSLYMLEVSFAGYNNMTKAGISTPVLYESESIPDEFIVVSKEEIKWTLEDFLVAWDKKIVPTRYRLITPGMKKVFYNATKAETEKAFAALISFAGETWAFSSFLDFTADQIGWNGIKWLYFDPAHGAGKVRNPNSSLTVWSPKIFQEQPYNSFYKRAIPEDIYNKMLKVIYAKRKRNLHKSDKCRIFFKKY